MKSRVITVVLWSLTLLWLVFSIVNIYIPLSRAGELSHTITEEVYEVVTPSDKLEEDIKKDRNDDLVNSYEKYTRKAGHLIQYAALGVLLSLSISRHTDKEHLIYGITVTAGIIFASTDEFLQSFLDFRSGLFKDVLIDAGGVIIGCMIVFLIHILIYKRKQHNEK